MNNRLYLSLALFFGMAVTGPVSAESCSSITPITSVKTFGGGQSQSVNNTMYAVFTGHIVTTDGLTNRGKNTVKICNETSVDYKVIGKTSTGRMGETIEHRATCAGAAGSGRLSSGNKLVCTNANLGGSDTDRFRIVGVN